ncbi:hypothetical protein [Micromonospora sp. NBC_00421]|uniref:hypothetical protein n=1 Tax=Micromonospora sp. NBC_00421 TaxID=2975976 RepID=UPI002E1A4F94
MSQTDIDKAMSAATGLTFWARVPDIAQEVALFEQKYPAVKVKVVNGHRGQLLVADRSGAGGAGLGGVVGRRCDLRRRVVQRPQDRLDTVFGLPGVDEVDPHRDGRSNSAAMKLAADFRICMSSKTA